MQDGVQLNKAIHLVRRFFGYLTARPLTINEREEVAGLLSPELATLYFGMQVPDQRHALEVYQRIGDPELAEAALLHDVGKSVSRLGPLTRSMATMWGAMHLPTKGSWQLYLDHGPIGAQLLAESGANALAVSFARNHPGPVPADVDATLWQRLADADEI